MNKHKLYIIVKKIRNHLFAINKYVLIICYKYYDLYVYIQKN